MEKNLLDNMSGQEIKELIVDKIITLQELSDSALEKVLDFETEMLCHNSGDMDIIRQCSEILDERNKSDRLNEDEISTIINKAKTEHVSVVDADNACPSVVAPQRKIRLIFKRIAIVAAAILVIMTTTVAIATAFGVDITRYLKSIMREPDGAVIHVDGMSIYNVKNPTIYKSVQEMLEAEKIDIMYPTVFPEGVTFKNICVGEHANGDQYIDFRVNDVWVGLSIELDAPKFTASNPITYEHNGITYYIDKSKNGWYATCYYNNDQYLIQAYSYDDLILIIDNMKE